MRILFTVTLFLSSVLLFLIEPMIAKMILPRFGGSPGVWNTSMLFFQAALLAGYGYAHVTTKWLGPRVQALTHIVVLLLPLVVLPFALPRGIESGTGNPAPLVLLILTIAVGLPFLVVSAGAPLLQRWFAATDDPHAKDPYFLYSASNLGSMLALLAYPFLIEPALRLTDQARVWTYGYGTMAVMMAVCALLLWVKRGSDQHIHEAPANLPPAASEESPELSPTPTPPSQRQATLRDGTSDISWKRRLLWIGLAFCPSSLLLGVTTFLTSNIAPIPLLWVVPLALYLLTFIIAFAKKQVIPVAILGRALPLLMIPLAFTLILESSEPGIMIPLIVLNLLVVFVASLMCHTELANKRPEPVHLTEFYFYVSLGGVLGGLFNALIAPTIFNSYFEYPLILALACAFRPRPENWNFKKLDLIYPACLGVVVVITALIGKALTIDPDAERSAITIGIPLLLVFFAIDRPIRFAASLFVLFAGTSLMQVAVAGHIIEAKRSFFGVHRIEQYTNAYGTFRDLIHGNTVHGKENFTPRGKETPGGSYVGLPLTYYHPAGPIGQVFRIIGPSRHNVALVGLGIGSLAAYGQPGQNFTYFEIDPDVVEIASDPKLFTFVHDCKANLKMIVGDARLELAKAPPNSYDMIVLDAFSSDSIPIHLLTEEAVEMYLSKLQPGGLLAFHISNHYIDLKPVLGNEAKSLNLNAWVQDDNNDVDITKDVSNLMIGKYPSQWVVMARSAKDFGQLRRESNAWEYLDPEPGLPVWTDDYSNLVSVLKIGRRAKE